MKFLLNVRQVVPGMLLASVCLTASASEPPAGTDAPAVSAGMKVGIDPATGKLRPLTEEESRNLDRRAAPATSQSKGAPSARPAFTSPANAAASRATMRRGIGGTVSVKLPEDQMNTLRATRDANGQVHITEHAGSAPDAPVSHDDNAGEAL